MSSKNTSRKIPRRDFLKMAATAALLAGCRTKPAQVTPMSSPTDASVDTPPPADTPTPAPTDAPTNTPTPANTPTRAPTRTPRPTSTVVPTPTTVARKVELVKVYPEVQSQVVHTHHAGVWGGDDLVPNALREMLNASITQLTGLKDAREAWRALFAPEERIAIKVNAFRNSVIWTHMPLVMAVTDALQDAGMPAENLVIFDYYTRELEEVGYTVNRDGPGVRCYGTDRDYTSGWRIVDTAIELSDVLLSCDALINMPVLKSHRIAGLTFALKNHYGTLSHPERFHRGDRIDWGMPELNALPAIKDRTRLIIGDMLEACLRYNNAYPYWEADLRGDAILMSFDPVAHDAVGFEVFKTLLDADGGNASAAAHKVAAWLGNATELGLGTHDPAHMDVVEVTL